MAAVTEHIITVGLFCFLFGVFLVICNLSESAETLADILRPGSNQRLLSAWPQKWFVPAPCEFA